MTLGRNGSFGGVIHDVRSGRNGTGVLLDGVSTLRDSRVYGNTTGVFLRSSSGGTATGNTVYSNATGIYVVNTSYGPVTVANNLVYGDSGRGILLENVQQYTGAPLVLVNNTVMELGADAVQVTGNSQNVQLKNNVLWAGGLGHYAINVANTAQRGFTSDYNSVMSRFSTDGGNTVMDLASWQVLGAASECASLTWNPPGGVRPRCTGTAAKLACH